MRFPMSASNNGSEEVEGMRVFALRRLKDLEDAAAGPVGALAAAAVLLLAGCAAEPAAAPAGSPPAAAAPAEIGLVERLAEIERDVAAIRTGLDPAKPPIDELLEVEGDIQSLVTRLQQSGPAAAPPAPERPVAIATAPIGPPAAPAEGAFAIHLASYQKKDSVLDGWTEYRKQYRGVLDGLQPRVAAIDLKDGRGTLYRLKAGPFATEAAARAACRKVAAYPAGYCRVMDFSGLPGPQFWSRGGS
jgi:hypothetical protein